MAVFLTINQIFDLRLFVGYMLYETSYYYLIFALIVPLAFLNIPVKKTTRAGWAKVFFRLDVAIFLMLIAFSLYFAWNGFKITVEGWGRVAPLQATIMAAIIWFFIVEGVRRAVSLALAIVVLIVSLYPTFTEYLPGLFGGVGRSFPLTAQFHLLGGASVIGTLMGLFTNFIVGFTLFGAAVLATGGGRMFLNLALSLVGRTRGGTAKVAVVASAMFGSVSGSSPVNVITTGCVTIPAMKRAGFSPHFAGAVECVASTAGTFTPPIMGAAAFVMASFLVTPYPVIALAAAVPALLYYFGLFVQIDGRAAKLHLKGLAKGETPSFIDALKSSWFFFPAAAVLLYYLFVLRLVGESPYIAVAVLLALAQIRKETRFTLQSFIHFIENTGQLLMVLLVSIAGVAMLVGSFSITGIAVSFPRELLQLAGGSIAFMLLFCAISSLIMGMGMPTLACYVFLAIVIAPALVIAGLDKLSVHLFVLYYGMLSYITPPVAMCAFPAAVIAGTSPMKVGFTAVRLAGVLYILPFFFVLDPALILHGGVVDILRAILSTMLGVFLIGSAFEGYMLGIGRLWPAESRGQMLAGISLRGVIIASGICLGLPWWQIKVLGLAIAVIIMFPTFIVAYRQRRRLFSQQSVITQKETSIPSL